MQWRFSYFSDDFTSEDYEENKSENFNASDVEATTKETLMDDSLVMIIEKFDSANDMLSLGVDALIVTVVFLGALLGAHIIRSLRK